MSIREANIEDFDKIWPIFNEVVSKGETYSYPKETTKDEAKKLWMEIPKVTFVYEESNEILGTYYIKTNNYGGGSHICNCGYMVSPNARGKGVATKMCEHSQQVAKEFGYKGMQFNFVVSTNISAIKLWLKLGYDKVGTLPKAFNHPNKGYVDAFVMYKWFE